MSVSVIHRQSVVPPLQHHPVYTLGKRGQASDFRVPIEAGARNAHTWAHTHTDTHTQTYTNTRHRHATKPHTAKCICMCARVRACIRGEHTHTCMSWVLLGKVSLLCAGCCAARY